MHARITTVNGASNVDEWVTHVKENVAPEVSQMRGHRGLTVSYDRAANMVGILSLWETEADLQDSEGPVSKIRQETLERLGGNATVAAFELLIDEISKPPEAGNALIVRRAGGDPARVEEGIAFVRDEAIPMLKAMPGFRAVRVMANLQTGESVIGAVYDSPSALAAAREKVEPPSFERAASLGVTVGDASVREILFTTRQ